MLLLDVDVGNGALAADALEGVLQVGAVGLVVHFVDFEVGVERAEELLGLAAEGAV